MTTPEALRALYAALGGDADDVEGLTIIPDLINAIAALISDQGIAALPAVEAPGDNGKVLTVVDGEWAAAALPD